MEFNVLPGTCDLYNVLACRIMIKYFWNGVGFNPSCKRDEAKGQKIKEGHDLSAYSCRRRSQVTPCYLFRRSVFELPRGQRSVSEGLNSGLRCITKPEL